VIDFLKHVQAEALCRHALRVEPGPAYASLLVQHERERCVFRADSLATDSRDRQMRRAIHDWLMELHAWREVA
jgi:hypothetical protein